MQLEGAPQADDIEGLNQRLAQANRFKPDALTANRAGRLTNRQRAVMLGRFAVYAIGGFVVVALFIAALFQMTSISENLWFLAAFSMIVIAFTLIVLYDKRGSFTDIFQGQVLSTSGTVEKDYTLELDHESQSTTAIYYYQVNENILFLLSLMVLRVWFMGASLP